MCSLLLNRRAGGGGDGSMQSDRRNDMFRDGGIKKRLPEEAREALVLKCRVGGRWANVKKL